MLKFIRNSQFLIIYGGDDGYFTRVRKILDKNVYLYSSVDFRNKKVITGQNLFYL